MIADPYVRARQLAREAEAAGADLPDYIQQHAPDLFTEAVSPTAPAESLIQTCQRHGIALRLDADGSLIVGRSDLAGKEPGIWLELAAAIEVHAAAIAKLVEAGWQLRAQVKATSPCN
jgi:hypothetical protein